MRRQEFLDVLRSGLSGLSESEIEERVGFYREMIDDRIEEGYTEQQAVDAVGCADEICAQIMAEAGGCRQEHGDEKPRRRIGAWEIVLLVLGSPIWLSLLIAAVAVFISMYAVLWSLAAAMWSIFATLAAVGCGGIIMGVFTVIGGNAAAGIALIGAGLFCIGLAVFMFFLCVEATRGIVSLTVKSVKGIKSIFTKWGERDE